MLVISPLSYGCKTRSVPKVRSSQYPFLVFSFVISVHVSSVQFYIIPFSLEDIGERATMNRCL